MKQPAKAIQVTIPQKLNASVDLGDHGLLRREDLRIVQIAGLFVKNRRGRTRHAEVKQRQRGLQSLNGVGCQKNPLDGRSSVGMEYELIKAAKSRGILVLLANRLLENVDLDMARLFRQSG